MRRLNAKRILAAMTLLAAALPFALSGCGEAGSQALAKTPPEVKPVKVEVVEVRPVTFKDVMMLPGATNPYHDLVVASDQAGRVEWVGPREGDRVKQGELLVKVDVSMLKAALDNAKAAYCLADDLNRRRETLYQRKIISREELDKTVTERSVRWGALRQAQVQYDQGFIHSPIDGVVNRFHVDPGEFVGRGAPVAELVNVDRIKVEINVPELDVKYLKVGDPVRIGIDALPGREVAGVIDFVSLKADPVTKTFRVKILVDNADGAIRPGMIARVALLRRLVPDALVAPLFALVDKGGERYLFVENSGVARIRRVDTGIINGDQVQITKGLQPGDRLIVVGQTEVEDGTRVVAQ